MVDKIYESLRDELHKANDELSYAQKRLDGSNVELKDAERELAAAEEHFEDAKQATIAREIEVKDARVDVETSQHQYNHLKQHVLERTAVRNEIQRKFERRPLEKEAEDQIKKGGKRLMDFEKKPSKNMIRKALKEKFQATKNSERSKDSEEEKKEENGKGNIKKRA